MLRSPWSQGRGDGDIRGPALATVRPPAQALAIRLDASAPTTGAGLDRRPTRGSGRVTRMGKGAMAGERNR